MQRCVFWVRFFDLFSPSRDFADSFVTVPPPLLVEAGRSPCSPVSAMILETRNICVCTKKK
eukprot:NODE_5517_length_309_cov_179.403846_g4905_i0.p2 GENE.NODE_5517_length_309_cov_179.403846_g4905_i0~~NODE_5517_length_309_cov_179.403846_g4905_i0.p2  ORF type:complete len:61 (+),score=9.01 NODE_5517_length_309_cov_179.403846_g4905_i0:96-278(+)